MSGRGIVPGLMFIAASAIVTGSAPGQIPQADQPAALSMEERSVVDRISANSLRGNVSFLASDLLEGRGTPSRGLDLAAEFIAAQFRRAGLEAAGDEGYFQTAHWREARFDPEGFSASLHVGNAVVPLKLEQTSLHYAEHPIDLRLVTLFKVSAIDERAQHAIPPGDVKGKVILVEQPDPQKFGAAIRDQVMGGYFRYLDRLASEQAVLVLNIDRKSKTGWGLELGRLVDPEHGGGSSRPRQRAEGPDSGPDRARPEGDRTTGRFAGG